MEMVEIIATANFISGRLGSVTRKSRLRVSRAMADELIGLGVAKPNPLIPVRLQNPPLTEPLGVGGAETWSSLPAGQASPRPIATLLQAPAGKSSSLTTPGSEPPMPMSSMPAIEPGGRFTTKRSKRALKASAGRKTLEQPSALA